MTRNLERHGATRNGKQPSEYQIWSQIKQRCMNPNHPKFHRYGGRGIVMDPAWADSFSTFREAVGRRPSRRHTLERLNNNRGYIPGNVKWATKKQQNRNLSSNRIVNYRGTDYVLADLAEQMGMSRKRLQGRLDAGFTVEDAVELPVERSRVFFEYGGETHSLTVWARKLKIPYRKLYNRMTKQGMTFEQAVAAG